MGDPINIKTKRKRAKGFIKDIIGDIPKSGLFQSKVLGKTQDLVARAVAMPDPALNMDQIGVPKDALWKMFKPFVMRRLVQRGIPALAAADAIENRTPQAQEALEREIKERPVMMDRAPALHKFNMMAGYAVPRNDTSLGFPVSTAPGYNADFDGDQLNLHVPVTEEAKEEAVKKLLPSTNLFSIKTHGVHFVPQHEAGLGLYFASKTPNKTAVKKFSTQEEAIQAYRDGTIKLNDPIEVG